MMTPDGTIRPIRRLARADPLAAWAEDGPLPAAAPPDTADDGFVEERVVSPYFARLFQQQAAASFRSPPVP